jgi:hypothetical protein
VALAVDIPGERLVKSDERVRDLGEVFTPSATVQEILDLLPEYMWVVHPSPTFLEPACGDGNFLVAILHRKLERVAASYRAQRLPAGTDAGAAQFHALEALASIYGVDISADNIIGGAPGHEIGARTRLVTSFVEWHWEVLSIRLNERSLAHRAAQWIVEHNILVGNMLPATPDGRETGRENLPVVEYRFNPTDGSVSLLVQPMADVFAASEAVAPPPGQLLYEPNEPEPFWTGAATQLSKVTDPREPRPRGPLGPDLRRGQ